MFTGIIEEIGRLADICQRGSSLKLKINAQTILADLHLGDSIAVNGVCLTVTSFTPTWFWVDVTPITFYATTLASLSRGSKLNLERALAANSRFGGHIVTGHVDGVGLIRQIKPLENAQIYQIQLEPHLARNCVENGSIAVDGTSLTLVEVATDWFKLALIPHTRQQTILGQKKVGDKVNLECDILIKQQRNLYPQPKSGSRLSLEFLQQHGYV